MIETAEVFEPLLYPARYKGAYGGRGSGKSQFFGDQTIEDSLAAPGEMGEGLRMVCIREVQKSLKHSAKSLIESKIRQFGLTEDDGFKSYGDVIKTPGDGLIIFQGMQDHTADSIKSLEGFHRGWVEEAQTLSAFSLSLLRPTIRWEDQSRSLYSQLWFSWNPRRKIDPVDMMFRGQDMPKGAACVRANWSDNPWFPSVLEDERQDCLKNTPDQYDHIWEGGYATVFSGAYFAELISTARRERRIGKLSPDPLLSVRAYWDIGGTGAKADATSIWLVQFVGKEIRVLDYYEAQGQPLSTHVNWLRERGYSDITCVLPHDGVTNDKVHDASYEKSLEEAGFNVIVVPNQGKGAASRRIEAVRRLLPNCWFHEPDAPVSIESIEATTAPGIDALGWYHEKRDDARNVGLGPEHDWSSHAADAFGLMCIAYEEHTKPNIDISRFEMTAARGGWLGA